MACLNLAPRALALSSRLQVILAGTLSERAGIASTVTEAGLLLHLHCADHDLLVSKQYKELIQPYDERTARVLQFVGSAKPQLRCHVFCLEDPNEPTPAETNPEVGALVTSEETLSGAQKINEGRAKRGLPELVLMIVPVIGAMSEGQDKLSSTALRRADYEARE